MTSSQLSLLRLTPTQRPRRAFHAQAHITAAEAAAGEARAQTQQAEILEHFRSRDRRLTPSEVWREMGQRWPLTSVRRAITNLAAAGELVHHQGDRRPGLYGAMEGTWSAAP